jgi:hypothetical protein
MDMETPGSLGNPVLNEIHEGMTVVDSDGDKIGTVEFVYLGAVGESGAEDGLGPATTNETRTAGDEGWLTDLAGALAFDEGLPQTIRDRMVRGGYIKIDRGLLKGDRFAIPDQIASVVEDTVRLSVDEDALIHKDAGALR